MITMITSLLTGKKLILIAIISIAMAVCGFMIYSFFNRAVELEKRELQAEVEVEKEKRKRDKIKTKFKEEQLSKKQELNRESKKLEELNSRRHFESQNDDPNFVIVN